MPDPIDPKFLPRMPLVMRPNMVPDSKGPRARLGVAVSHATRDPLLPRVPLFQVVPISANPDPFSMKPRPFDSSFDLVSESR